MDIKKKKKYKPASSSSVHCLLAISWFVKTFLSILKQNLLHYMNLGSSIYFTYNANVSVCKRSIIWQINCSSWV